MLIFIYIHNVINPVQLLSDISINSRLVVTSTASSPAHHTHQMPPGREEHKWTAAISLQKEQDTNYQFPQKCHCF